MNSLTWDKATEAAVEADALGAAAAAPEQTASGGLCTRRKRVPAKDVAGITAQLAIMTRSGVDIATAMNSLATQCERPELAEVLEQVRDDVIGGQRFSEALRRHPRVFDEAYVATVGAGEATGRMPEIFAQLAELKRSELKLRRTITALLIYPILLATVSLVVITALMTFVLPQFASIFNQYDASLPVLTQVLLAIAEELRNRWWLWAPLGVAGIAGLASLRFTETGRKWVDRFLVETGGIGPVSQKLIVGRMCGLMGLMIESGVPLLESLRLVGKSTKNTMYRELVDDLEEAITNGRGLTPTLQESHIFPAAATEMIGTAERSGKLGEVLRMVGAYFEEEGEASARTAVGAMEPIITVVMGSIVAVVVLAVMLPVFDLATVAKGGH